MAHRIGIVIALVAAFSLGAVALGTLAPVDSATGPYVSALSDAAVNSASAEADASCMNPKACQGNHCVPAVSTACGVQGHECVQANCP